MSTRVTIIEADRAVMADLNRPCLFHAAGPCQHPKCLEAHSETLRAEMQARRDETERVERRKGNSPLTAKTLPARLAGEPPAPAGAWREGGIDIQIFNNRVTVSIERSGKFIPVISTYHGGVTSHAVWPSGINKAIEEAAK